MADLWDHFQATSEYPTVVVCTTCHSKLSKNSRESVLKRHFKTRKHMKALSKLRHETSISSVKKPKLSAQEKTEIFQPQMEDVILRFPHLAEKILDSLESKSLTTCREVSRSWDNFVSRKKFFLIRFIEKVVVFFHVLGDDWKKVFKKATTETIMDLRHEVGIFYLRPGLHYHKGLTPSHVAAGTGNLKLLKLIENIAKSKNPKDEQGLSLLHYAAQNGHFNIVEHVMTMTKEISPLSEDKSCKVCGSETPLERAYKKDYWQICEYILENVEDILDPKTSVWKDHTVQIGDRHIISPLKIAARMGNIKLCQIILTNMDNEDHFLIKSYCSSAIACSASNYQWNTSQLISNYCAEKLEVQELP
jgi:hypothetical protein